MGVVHTQGMKSIEGICRVVECPIPKSDVDRKNKKKDWQYGYNEEYDLIIISKDGTIGEIYLIGGLYIALPKAPSISKIASSGSTAKQQYFVPRPVPDDLKKVKNIYKWKEKSQAFKQKYIGYIEDEFTYRNNGYWFMNYGVPTYMTGSNYMYLTHSKIDVGLPDYREANRVFWLFWEACKADKRSYGMNYVKIRRSGFSFMSSGEGVNTVTSRTNSRVGILSKTGADAKKMFTDKVVNIAINYPFFFKPIQDGMEKPKTELVYGIPARKITRNNMNSLDEDEDLQGLDSVLDWMNTANNSYDGQKLVLLIHDESGKWEKPNNIEINHGITKTCCRVGKKIIGKIMMGSTVNPLDKGGSQYKSIFDGSDVTKRSENGQTKSGLYGLFIPMEYNMEGYIDRYGFPVIETPKTPIEGIDGEDIIESAVDFWEKEAKSLSDDSVKLNEFYRQFPRTLQHAFRDEATQSIFNINKIYEQLDYNDLALKEVDRPIVRGNLHWENGIKDSKAIWTSSPNGVFYTTWLPAPNKTNRVGTKNGMKIPLNEHLGAFGCDSYDISGTVDGRGSNGALHGLLKYHMDEAPTNRFFLEYIDRPKTAEDFYENILLAIHFFGMPILVENNKPRLLYYMKHRGYRKFSINRPDRGGGQLSKTERELGGIPNTSQDVKQAHASAIKAWIEKYVGYDTDGAYRSPELMGEMYFNRTLNDWIKFDVNNRTKFDASISSGLAIMACQQELYRPKVTKTKINVNFANYSNNSRYR